MSSFDIGGRPENFRKIEQLVTVPLPQPQTEEATPAGDSLETRSGGKRFSFKDAAGLYAEGRLTNPDVDSVLTHLLEKFDMPKLETNPQGRLTPENMATWFAEAMKTLENLEGPSTQPKPKREDLSSPQRRQARELRSSEVDPQRTSQRGGAPDLLADLLGLQHQPIQPEAY